LWIADYAGITVIAKTVLYHKSPLPPERGKVGMGVESVSAELDWRGYGNISNPHLDPPPCWGRKKFTLTAVESLFSSRD
jgi:hypothetical protein